MRGGIRVAMARSGDGWFESCFGDGEGDCERGSVEMDALPSELGLLPLWVDIARRGGVEGRNEIDPAIR